MKKIVASISIFTALLSFLLINFSSAKNNPHKFSDMHEQCGVYSTPFQVGEHLTYKMYYNWTAVWMSAGKVTFSLKEDYMHGKPVFHAVGEGKTAPSFDWFFKVRDRYETFLDPETVKPLKFIRSVQEGDYTKNNLFTFFHDDNEVLVNYRKRMGKLQAENETISIPGCTHDILSAIYYTRTINYQNMEVGDVIPVDVFLDGEVYNLHARYLGKDELKVNGSKYRCVKFSPLLVEGDIFKDDEGLVVWATDDANRLPLMIESKLAVGSVKAYIVDWKGLKYDLTSKVK